MVGWKRIWLACLLAIAGSGPLPLWLHQLVCHHGSGDHAATCGLGGCGPSGCGPGLCATGSSPVANGDRHAAASACAHHGHAVHHASHGAGAVASKVAEGVKAKRVLRLSSTGSGHDDCAACYVLSQPTVISSIRSVPHSAYYLPAHPLAAARLLPSELAAAYSSRAPPVI